VRVGAGLEILADSQRTNILPSLPLWPEPVAHLSELTGPRFLNFKTA
jgi:hypothetical protein